MDLQLTEEQELLRSSIQRFLRDQYNFDERRKIIATDEGWSRKHWSAFAELGLCAAPFQESSGGLGGGALATMIVMQEFGRKLVVEPYLETVVLAGGLIEDVGSPEQRASFLPAIMDGSAIWTLAWAEGRSRYDFNNVVTTARRQGDRFVLSGTKAAVIGAPWADKLIVSARTSGGPRDRSGVALGTVQVLQHRMVDMFIALEESISLTQHLNLSLASREPNGSKLASGAKTKVGYSARFVAEQAVQLHGGMGMSDELNVGHYFKRISSINVQLGDPAYHLMRYTQQS